MNILRSRAHLHSTAATLGHRPFLLSRHRYTAPTAAAERSCFLAPRRPGFTVVRVIAHDHAIIPHHPRASAMALQPLFPPHARCKKLGTARGLRAPLLICPWMHAGRTGALRGPSGNLIVLLARLLEVNDLIEFVGDKRGAADKRAVDVWFEGRPSRQSLHLVMICSGSASTREPVQMQCKMRLHQGEHWAGTLEAWGSW